MSTGPILVTGASGFIGGGLVRALREGGHDVRALVRRDVEFGDGIAVVQGELSNPSALRRAAAGCRLVYHLAGPYRGSPAALRSAHVDGTAGLLAALDPGTRVVYVSSTSVYGWEQDWPAGTSSPPRPSSAYGAAKLAAEGCVLDRSPTVVIRPTIVYGPGDNQGMLPRAWGLMRRGVRDFPGTGTNHVHLIHIDDLVSALLAAGTSGAGVYVVAGPSSAPISTILGLLAGGAGLAPPRFGRLPAGAVRPLAAAVESIWPGEPPLSRHSLDVATRHRHYDWSRATAELGWSPGVSIEEGVPATGAWLAAQRSPNRARAGANAGADANAGPGGSTGFDWRGYFVDPDEGLGTVYERFALDRVLTTAMACSGSSSVLHAPAFGMMGIPGLDAVMLARRGARVGLLDFDAERLQAVRAVWESLGLNIETHLVDGPDPRTWPDQLEGEPYDLVFSFAALWWFSDPDAVVAAQTRWARRAVVCAVPNKNVFMRMRAALWHRSLFTELNAAALDIPALDESARRRGWAPVLEGLFDLPPFPDTSVPLAKLVRGWSGRQAGGGDRVGVVHPALPTRRAARPP